MGGQVMIDVSVLLAETAEILESTCPDTKDAYIGKWIPALTNEIEALREQVFLLNLQLTEASSEKE